MSIDDFAKFIRGISYKIAKGFAALSGLMIIVR